MPKDDGKFGVGISPEELISPLNVGPSKGQEGWTPANPEIAEARDPLGYIPADSPKHDRY